MNAVHRREGQNLRRKKNKSWGLSYIFFLKCYGLWRHHSSKKQTEKNKFILVISYAKLKGKTFPQRGRLFGASIFGLLF